MPSLSRAPRGEAQFHGVPAGPHNDDRQGPAKPESEAVVQSKTIEDVAHIEEQMRRVLDDGPEREQPKGSDQCVGH